MLRPASRRNTDEAESQIGSILNSSTHSHFLQQNAVRHELHFAVLAHGVRVITDLIAHLSLASTGRVEFLRHTARHGDGSYATGLCDADQTGVTALGTAVARLEEELGDLRRVRELP